MCLIGGENMALSAGYISNTTATTIHYKSFVYERVVNNRRLKYTLLLENTLLTRNRYHTIRPLDLPMKYLNLEEKYAMLIKH